MNNIICKNIYVSKDENIRKKNFNEIWQIIVNRSINNKNFK